MTSFDFAVWAPKPESVELRIRPVGSASPSGESRIPMERDEEGWWRPSAPLPQDGVGEFDYGYVLNGSETVLPDPRSQRQPEGVHGWSRTYDATAYPWQDERWTGRQLAGGVIYEMHGRAVGGGGHLEDARRHLPPRRHAGGRDRQARPSGRPGHRLRRAAAGE